MTPIQHSVIVALYELTIATGAKWFIKTKKVNIYTIKSLYDMGMIETDKCINGIPVHFKLTEKGKDYGRQYYSGNKERPTNKNREFTAGNKYKHYEYVNSRTDIL